MSINQFTDTIKSKVFKDWLATLDKNIINTSVKNLRSKEQTASKTSFYITEDTVRDMFKTITGNSLDKVEVQLFLAELGAQLDPGDSKSLPGKRISVNGKEAVIFESIGFDTISTKLSQLLSAYPEVEAAYFEAENNFLDEQLKSLRQSAEYKAMKTAEKNKAEREIEKKAKERATFGYYFNKGHVISVATNLAKQFKEDLQKADKLSKEQQKVLTEVLDKYISKMQKEDLATANLPNAVDQELYASYVKSSNKYLVELQYRVGNIESGSASAPIVNELRSLFSGTVEDLVKIVNKSPALGEALLEGEGSPSYKQLIVNNMVNILLGKRLDTKVYVQQPILIGKKTNKISKPASKSKEIAKAKALKNKVRLAGTKSAAVNNIPLPETNLIKLLNLINSLLQDVISANMGDGDRRDILNYRTGRLAASAKVENITESRAGMITAFYTYMRNPYATFSEGGRQQNPRSRDPKLLISKSIREIAAQQVGNRLRAIAL